MLTWQNGILNRAVEAKEKTEVAQKECKKNKQSNKRKQKIQSKKWHNIQSILFKKRKWNIFNRFFRSIVKHKNRKQVNIEQTICWWKGRKAGFTSKTKWRNNSKYRTSNEKLEGGKDGWE